MTHSNLLSGIKLIYNEICQTRTVIPRKTWMTCLRAIMKYRTDESMLVTLTFVSGAVSILNCLTISIRAILDSMRARRIPIHFLGPIPKGMCAQGCRADFWVLSNLHQNGIEEHQWRRADSETMWLQQQHLSGLKVSGSGHRSSL